MLLKASPTPCLVTNALIWVSQRQPCPEKRKLTKSYESKLVYPLRPKAHRAECAFHFSRQCYHCSRERWLTFKTTIFNTWEVVRMMELQNVRWTQFWMPGNATKPVLVATASLKFSQYDLQEYKNTQNGNTRIKKILSTKKY